NVRFVKACVSCCSHFSTIEELGRHMQTNHEPKTHPELERSFLGLNNVNKWNSLVDHPSSSFILDVEDQTYLKHGIFTESEMEEIKNENAVSITVPIPIELRDYLNSFNCNTTKQIRQSLAKRQHWEYESKSLSSSKKELWYNIHIWSFIDRLFDDIPALEVVRVIGSLKPLERRMIGYKCDFLVRDTTSEHEESLEYGAGEVGIKYEQKGTKLMTEGSVKLPKVLKDMLDQLIIKNKDYKNIQSFGVVHSGLTMQLITADRPYQYITRITRGKELKIPSDVAKFGDSVLPVLVQVWQLKQHILNVQNKIMSPSNTKHNDSHWLDDCLTKGDNYIIPQTSNSTEYTT
ncbi:uncharacterized protein EV154DRAFT_418417, partial [Mucor mucedo]|uniref:uncharacterized protein n=1 Tax=Mucor mucedo TaxID=29922 RepID=UPI00221E8460